MSDKIDYKFLSDREGGRKLLGYVPASNNSKSGVTIATGFDLGQRNEADLKKLKLSKTLIDKLKPYLGATKKDALAAIKKKPLMLNAAQAEEIDKVVKSTHITSLASKYNAAIKNGDTKFNDLPPEVQTVIASVSFQYGTGLQRRAPKFWKAATSQDWEKTKEVLDDFGDDYKSRRKLESDLLNNMKKSK